MEDQKRIEFEVGGVRYAVVRPSPGVFARGNRVYSLKLKKAVSAAAPRRGRLLEERMRRTGIWDDDKAAEDERLHAAVVENEGLLAREDMPLARREEAALELRRLRARLIDLNRERGELDGRTAEAKASNAQFDYLVTRCLVFAETGLPVYSDPADYREHGEEPHALRGASLLAYLLVPELDPDWEKNLPENVFLAAHASA